MHARALIEFAYPANNNPRPDDVAAVSHQSHNFSGDVSRRSRAKLSYRLRRPQPSTGR
jgi:hypothetical protein